MYECILEVLGPLLGIAEHRAPSACSATGLPKEDLEGMLLCL